jgi:lysozyme
MATTPKSSASKAAATGIAAVFAAAALATPLVIRNEGWVLTTAPDPIGIPTACAGVTAGVQSGRTYSQQACEEKTAQALLQHGLEIRPCLPAELPTETRAAFTSFAYNIGAPKFCASTASKMALQGDLRGACAQMSKWIDAGGHPLPGLVVRRREERAMCEEGLRASPPPTSAAPAQPGFFHRLFGRFA